MDKSTILAVKVIGDATSGARALTDVDNRAAKLEGTFKTARLAAGLFFAFLIASAVSIAGVASDLQQASGAVDAVFSSYSDGVHKAASTASQDVGLAEDQYSQLASVLGSQLKNLGVSQDQLGGKTNDLIKLGADLSAMYGGTAAEAVEALSSLLRGERDPIERYGVSIKQADINAREAAMGLTGLTGEAQKSADLQATLAILLEQTGDASGRFAAEADTASGAQQRANAAWRDAQAQLGEALLPIISEGADVLANLAHWVGENKDLVLALAVAAGVLAAAFVVVTAAQWAFNVAAVANPIGLVILVIVLAIAALIGVVLLIIKYWDDIQRTAEDAWFAIQNFIYDASAAAVEFENHVIDIINWLAKLGSGELLSDQINDLLGLGNADFTPQLSRIQIGDRPAAITHVNNSTSIVVNGALDTNGVANQIKGLLKDNSQLVGSAPAGSNV